MGNRAASLPRETIPGSSSAIFPFDFKYSLGNSSEKQDASNFFVIRLIVEADYRAREGNNRHPLPHDAHPRDTVVGANLLGEHVRQT
jgi:hypothetical protein